MNLRIFICLLTIASQCFALETSNFVTRTIPIGEPFAKYLLSENSKTVTFLKTNTYDISKIFFKDSPPGSSTILDIRTWSIVAVNSPENIVKIEETLAPIPNCPSISPEKTEQDAAANP
jgi:hypothetical protein